MNENDTQQAEQFFLSGEEFYRDAFAKDNIHLIPTHILQTYFGMECDDDGLPTFEALSQENIEKTAERLGIKLQREDSFQTLGNIFKPKN